MAGKYNLCMGGYVIVTDDNGGMDVSEFMQQHGEFATICLFMEWMEEHKREQDILYRQQSIKVVKGAI